MPKKGGIKAYKPPRRKNFSSVLLANPNNCAILYGWTGLCRHGFVRGGWFTGRSPICSDFAVCRTSVLLSAPCFVRISARWGGGLPCLSLLCAWRRFLFRANAVCNRNLRLSLFGTCLCCFYRSFDLCHTFCALAGKHFSSLRWKNAARSSCVALGFVVGGGRSRIDSVSILKFCGGLVFRLAPFSRGMSTTPLFTLK